MTWLRFWRIGEKYCDRFYTVGLAIMVIDVLNSVPIRMGAVIGCIVVATGGGIFCTVFAYACTPDGAPEVKEV